MKYFLEKNKLFVILLNIFLISLIYLTFVIANNQIKESQYIGQNVEGQNTITVSAKGEVYTKPNLAKINFSVKTEAKTAGRAIDENSKKMNNVIIALKKLGVEKKDLKTTVFSIYPRYEWHRSSENIPINGQRILIGYEAEQRLEVKIRNLEDINKIIKSATDNGANKIGSLQFLVDEEDKFKDIAREKAIKKAKEKAKKIANELGINLRKIINFSEDYNDTRTYPLFSSSSFKDSNEETMPNIETGENKIEATVSITYRIN